MLLEYIPESHHNMGHIYSDLARTAFDKGDYQTTIQHDEKALKYFTATDIYDQQENIRRVYSQLAAAHQQLDKGEKELALEYLQQALNIGEQVLKRNKYEPLLATMYNNIGNIYIQLGD
ncbi:unnamed protein product, partial [Rotaria sordida]